MNKINLLWLELPNSGMASLTCGSVSATRFKNTVSDRRIVTPEKEFLKRNFCLETSFGSDYCRYFFFIDETTSQQLRKGNVSGVKTQLNVTTEKQCLEYRFGHKILQLLRMMDEQF